MFEYPERARKDRILPKNKIYENARPTRAVRECFIAQVDQIVWRYVLGPKNLNLPATTAVREIQVFEIALKAPAFGDPILREDVLRTIDRAIPSLLFFELTFQGRVRFVAAYKRASESVTAGQPVVDTYFETGWQDAAAPRQPLPVALDMGGLYEQMLRQHMAASPFALQSRSGESLPEAVERASRVRSQQLLCKKLELRLRREDQFNRKVEINASLRAAQSLLDELRD